MSDTSLDVRLRDGTVRGRRLGNLLTWRGIPYAAPPVGPLRFRAPQPPQPWDGVRDATRFGPPAPQASRFVRGREDCLTLNVVAPARRGNRRPVMVFIHGGAWTSGSSAVPLYRGDHLVRRGDIVYVSINYRLGSLGFLDFRSFSTSDIEFEANLGLRDQIAALEWVRDNIAEFGGDPDNVTVFGESAGGGAVTALMCVPSARGLFHRAIAQSPAAAASVHGPERAKQWAEEFVEMLGGGDDPAQALRDAPVAKLVATTQRLTLRDADTQPGLRATTPLVDGDLLPADPLDVFASGGAAPVPLIVGTNAHEGRLFPKFLDVLPTNAARLERMFQETDAALRDRIVAGYGGFTDRHGCIQLGGDVVFWEPSILVAQGHSGTAATFAYRYDFSTRALDLVGLGATHGMELLAVFGVGRDAIGRGATLLGGRRALQTVTRTVQSHWLHFARYGEPAPGWDAYTPERRATLIIDETSRMADDPRKELREAWIGYRHRR